MQERHLQWLQHEPPPPYVSEVAVEQQVSQITGTVVDGKGEPLIGVAVQVKGTAKGTVTNFDGQFTLDVKQGEWLIFSYIGYTTQNLKAAPGMRIVLSEDTQKLDEVVVVGYGSTTKRAMIASVSTVNAEAMENIPITNLTQGLAGRSKGLIVSGNGGGINKKQTISIRGGGTPLVVIDGVIRDYEDFVNLPPEDVEALSILKDASATAVYGSRATNGILQVTTKKGSVGKPEVEYNFNQSWSQPAIWPDVMDSWDRAHYANIARRNDGLAEEFSPEAIQTMRDGSDPLNYGNWKWRDIVLRNWAPQTKHNFRMTGGTEKNRYYVSLGHIDQNSLYKTNTHYMKRTNFRLSQSSVIEAIGLKTSVTLDGYAQKTVHPYSSTTSALTANSNPYYQVFSHIQNKSPLTPALNSMGLPFNTSDNPVAETSAEAGYSHLRQKAINGNISLEWMIPGVKGLSARANGNYHYYLETAKYWRKDAPQYAWDSDEPLIANNPTLSHSTKTEYQYNLQYFLAYNQTFGKHSVDALAGFEATYNKGDSYSEGRENYLFNVDQIFAGPADTQTNSGTEWESGRCGWIGQVKYNYDNRYFVEAAIRRDGSDNFPKNHRWGTFFSGSLGWIVSDEAFMTFLKDKHILDMLKVRASYGQVGLDNWTSGSPYEIGRFEYLPSYGMDAKGYVLNGKYYPVFTEGGIPSRDITWFTTDQFNIGFDFASLNNRLYGSFDYFYYSTTGFLYSPDPLKVGYTGPLGQSLPRVSTDGELRRAGYEFQLGWRSSIGAFKYDVSTNFTHYGELWNIQPSESETALMNPYTRSTQEYGYYGSMWENQGYFTSAEDVYNSVWPTGSHSLTAGDIKYYDFNGDGKLDGSDNHRLGRSANKPRGNYGINLNLSYKGWSLNVLFQGSTSFDMYAGDALRMNSGQLGKLPVIYDFQTDFWTPENRDAKFPRLMATPGSNGNNNYQYSDFWLINCRYFRMKDFKIGYDFKYSLLKNVKWLTKANVALSGQNIFTISDATKYGLDPENASMENYGYPNERTLAISVNLGF